MLPKSSLSLCLALVLFATTAQAANSVVMDVSATVLSKSNCKFPNGALTLPFGAIDPSGTSNASASATTTFSCAGSAPNATFLITQDGGLFNASGNRLQHATVAGAFLRYSLNLTPTSGTVAKNTTQTVTISGTIAPADYQQAIAGNYADTVTLTITP